MERIARHRRLVIALILPIFLLAMMFCVCPSASAQPASQSGDHDCCPGEKDGPQPIHEHQVGCSHCGGAQIFQAESVKLPAPAILLDLATPLADMAVGSLALDWSERPNFIYPEERPPPGGRALLSLKCAYLI